MAAGSDRPIEVLHVVGGVSPLGGVMAYVKNITTSQNTRVSHYIWKNREFRPPPGTSAQWVCEGRAKQTYRSAASDIIGAVRDVPMLRSWLRRHPGAILHAHTRLGHLASALVVLGTKTALLMHMHGRVNRPRVYHRMWRWTRACVAFNSSGTCKHFGCDPATSLIVMPTIEWPSHPPLVGGNSPDALRFVASGLFVPWKNIHLIIEAFNLLSVPEKAKELLLFGRSAEPGKSRYAQHIEDQARGNPAISLMGWDPCWTDKLTPADIFVHAAKDEPFGIVMLEAFAHGCRMVVPEDTFLDELPAPVNAAGIVRIERSDPVSLAAAMTAAADLPFKEGNLWERRRIVRDLFAASSATSRLAEIYKRIQMGKRGAK